MSSASTPSEAYHAEVQAYLNRRMTEMSDPVEGSPERDQQGGGMAVHDRSRAKGEEDFDPTAIGEVGSASNGQGPPKWTFFSGNDDDNRYRRLRCGMLLAAFNAQPLSVSMQERAKAWHELTTPDQYNSAQLPDRAPVIKSPIHLDYGNVRVAPTAFIHRNVFLGDNPLPEAAITIGEGAVMCPNVQILTVKHDVDWRHRDGFKGPGWAGGVVVGGHGYIGNGAIILPGCSVGDGCVIGAGAVVTRSMPAYHVAVGNPARPVWKVALDAPDAEGLAYASDGERMLVIQEGCESSDEAFDGRPADEDTQAINVPPRWNPEAVDTPPRDRFRRSMRVPPGQTSPDAARGLGYMKRETLRSEKREIERAVGVDIALLVVAVLAAWIIVHCALY
ncbi:hypothetical protein B0A55_02559 [Friedmanniomyces simplex]|uniref:Uncharacterized protein n=1 Tax=Friedmanniomyces simplex TaxID=329884 RepID=A0A4V5NHG9_9PEZI|nr:hypothetical protein B0A55_02559 [Friedmanniomyces simplex]